jgi:beta-lactamase regulating signal transducer with metallopeptidase domain
MIGSGLVDVPIPGGAGQTVSEGFAEGAQSQILPDGGVQTGAAANVPAIDAASPSTATTAFAELSLTTILLALWGIVAVGMFAYHMFRYIRFMRMIKRWGEAEEDEAVWSILRNVQSELGISGKKIDLKTCAFVSSSMLTGFLRPVILLPEKNFEHDELELIFRHELIHYKRRDVAVKLLSVIAVSMHWFNPFVYRMSSAMQAEGEASCDQAVLMDACDKDRHFYAEVIIGMIGGKNKAGTMLSTSFYGGKKGIKRRLTSIMDTTKKVRGLTSLSVIAVVLLVMFSGSIFAIAAQQPAFREQPDYDLNQPAEVPLPQGISLAEAREIAITTVGGGVVQQLDAEYEDGIMLIGIVIQHEGSIYHITLDAASGAVVEMFLLSEMPEDIYLPTQEEETPSDSPVQNEDVSQYIPPQNEVEITPPADASITLEQAIEIAYADLAARGISADFRADSGIEWEYGQWVWELEFRGSMGIIEFYINANTGAIVKFEIDGW